MDPLLPITSAAELITSREQTRTGFIEAALAKNEKARPHIEQARTLRTYALTASTPMALLDIPAIRPALLTASGLSDKAFKYFTDEDKTEAIEALIKNFLEPAGEDFADELTYRFLLIKGDSLGGSMRNYVGEVAQIKLVRKLLSLLTLRTIDYQFISKNKKKSNEWIPGDYETDFASAADINGIHWEYEGRNRLLFFNTSIPLVNKNVDICLFDGDTHDFAGGAIVNHPDKAVMFGELKGDIDPAGADEHWKIGNSALARIRVAFSPRPIQTSFIAAAIETSMANEIWAQLTTSTLNFAANLTSDPQLTSYCDWIISL